MTAVVIHYLPCRFEVDDTGPVDEPASGGDAGSDTTSLEPIMQKYREENGRRYHTFKDASYVWHTDDWEMDRQDLHDHLFSIMLGDKLYTAPMTKEPQHVLDVGKGSGIWPMDFADEYPAANVVGTDFTATQPPFVPPNLRFFGEDAEGT
ncbi:MAG: hypothetical protein M1833_004944 [Piccolia ochrophora]|nr:MAG: hypothetical protein M1833_004944 [Piccolia ochrophora]